MTKKYCKNIALAVAAVVSVSAALFIFNRVEGFKSKRAKRPPNSSDKLLNRTPVDKRVSQFATQTLGTKKTPIYIVDNFLSPAACEKLIESGKGKLVDSPLTYASTDANFRTSQTCYFDQKDGIQPIVEQKIFSLLGLPANAAEPSQLQHYRTGNQFKSHNDAFEGEGDHEFWINGQRTWTCMIYLNEPQKGGTTFFENLNENVVPRTGTAVIWCSLNKDGSVDQNTLHQGSPVVQGEKWITTTWFRDSPQF
jgi:prolyl 4-hydroxylase